MSVILQLTKDNSHTLYVPELDETYHSRNGAIEEAMYVYIGRGLLDFVSRDEEESAVGSPQSTVKSYADGSSSDIYHPTSNLKRQTSNVKQQTSNLKLLEIGFGTGLNAWLTALECEKNNIQCVYHSLETFPLSIDITQQLNYSALSTDPEQQLFNLLHEIEWNKSAQISSYFELTKHHVSLQYFTPAVTFDVIYFDAFAPEKQPELWSEELFQKLYDCLNPNGVIVTYSSKGDVKRLWKKIGFEVERLPGPPFKRHMLRGRK
jgi:tRNA U34 5-methylaminomethyl-2-thiouridine-forming methyltransferase MnmC